MKLKYITFLAFAALLFLSSCRKDEVKPTEEKPETTVESKLVQAFEGTDYTIEIYNESGKFYTGYNDLSIQVKKNADDSYVETESLSWMPMMAMETMNHSCPKSEITADGANKYKGFLIYQMTSMNETGWSLKFMFTIDGTEYMVEEDIIVKQSPRQRVATFMGTDTVKYILALVEPSKPEIAINSMTVGLFKMENMMMFPVVEDYLIKLDPRMPSMGNHSSPNNTDLLFDTTDKMYHGDLSLTMTGYWKLNLMLEDDEGNILKGEEVTDDNESSTLYLEIEF